MPKSNREEESHPWIEGLLQRAHADAAAIEDPTIRKSLHRTFFELRRAVEDIRQREIDLTIVGRMETSHLTAKWVDRVAQFIEEGMTPTRAGELLRLIAKALDMRVIHDSSEPSELDPLRPGDPDA